MSRYAPSQSNLVWHVYVLNGSQISRHGVVSFAEVHFYFIKVFGDGPRAFALISLYSPPNEHILRSTSDTLVVCRHQHERELTVIDVKSILSVIAMAPFPFLIDGHGNQYFMIEKMGLGVIKADALEDNE